MQQNQFEESIEKYCDFAKTAKKHDFEILREMGLLFLQNGSESAENQTTMMTLFGAGLCGSTHALKILERGMESDDPQMQLLALHFIAEIDDDHAVEILSRAMSSDFLAIRMEAALCLAQKKHPLVVGQIEGLMYRLPPLVRPYFPSLFAICGTNDATCVLKRLIEDSDLQTRVQSILQVAKLGRDDFLPTIRKRLTHTQVSEVEAEAFAVGVLKDNTSIPKLKRLAKSTIDSVQLAAAISLIQLGDPSEKEKIITLAKKGNFFAIAALRLT